MIGRRRWIAPAVVAGFVALVLAVPFERSWLDFEVARRGILGLVAAALAVPALLRARFDATSVLLLGLAAWHAVRSLGVANPMSGLARATHWLELWLVMQAAARVAPADLARAALPVLAAVAGFGLLQRLGIAPGGHGGPGEPVGTLGNLNVAAEVVAVCGGAAAAATVMMRRAWCGALLLGLAGIYLAGNRTPRRAGSRCRSRPCRLWGRAAAPNGFWWFGSLDPCMFHGLFPFFFNTPLDRCLVSPSFPYVLFFVSPFMLFPPFFWDNFFPKFFVCPFLSLGLGSPVSFPLLFFPMFCPLFPKDWTCSTLLPSAFS